VVVLVVETGVVLVVIVHVVVVLGLTVDVVEIGMVKMAVKTSGAIVDVTGGSVIACVAGAKSRTAITPKAACNIMEPRRCIAVPNSD